MTISEQINSVVEAREKKRVLKSQRDALLEDWNKANQELFDTLTQASAAVAEAEALLRDMALQVYSETKDKAVAPGVSVKIFEVLDYDSDEAMKWALEHRVALKLDTSTFEKIVKADKPNFVTITKEARAQIAQNLT